MDFLKNLGFRRLTLQILHFYIFTKGSARDPDSGFEMAYFDHNLNLIKNVGFKRLTLHFYIFTFLLGGLLRNLETGV